MVTLWFALLIGTTHIEDGSDEGNYIFCDCEPMWEKDVLGVRVHPKQMMTKTVIE